MPIRNIAQDFTEIQPELIKQFKGVVESMANRRAYQHLPACGADDLAQEGFIALMVEFNRFETSRNVQFLSYARHRISGAMSDTIRHECRTGRRDKSIDRSVSTEVLEEEDRAPWEVPANHVPEADAAMVEAKDFLARAAEKLTERERVILDCMYNKGLTMKETGVIIGVNESRVSQIHKQILDALRTTMLEMGVSNLSDLLFV